MALQTLKGITKIGGFEVTRGVSNFGANRPVFIHDETNQLAFQIQDGPIKEVGVNGCQVETVIETARVMLHGLNTVFPCEENKMAIDKLDAAIAWLAVRKANRETRGVEGTSQD